MKPSTHKQDARIIVYDAERIQQPGAELFAAHVWQCSGAVVGHAPGRGSALLLETEFGPAVLRHYLRGGWVARISRDRYLYTGLQRARPVAEFHLLASLYEEGLPVPRPLAAQCVREGLFYRGDLLTRRLPNVIPLADLPPARQVDLALWLATGACMRRFHDHGLVHADLNARNILIDNENQVYLIDFDRAKIRPGAARQFAANLQRLRRSLKKFLPSAALEQGWQQLLAGYSEESPARPT